MTLYGGMDAEERERIKAAFQADPSDLARAHPARHRRGLRGHRPPEPLLAPDPLRDPLEPEPAGAAQRPRRPPRPAGRRGARSTTSSARAATSRRMSGSERPGDLEGDLEFLMRAALKVDAIREDLGKVGPVIADQVEEAMLGRRTQPRHRRPPRATPSRRGGCSASSATSAADRAPARAAPRERARAAALARTTSARSSRSRSSSPASRR